MFIYHNITMDSFVAKKVLRDQNARWEKQLACATSYLNIYKNQISIHESNDTKDIFPFPMFEIDIVLDPCDRIQEDQVALVDKGLPLSFHVLFSEVMILRYMLE